MRLLMARPKRNDPNPNPSEGGTRHIRVAEDLARMLGDIIEVEGGTSAQFVDPLIRPQIVARYSELKPLIDQMAKVRQKARRRQE